MTVRHRKLTFPTLGQDKYGNKFRIYGHQLDKNMQGKFNANRQVFGENVEESCYTNQLRIFMNDHIWLDAQKYFNFSCSPDTVVAAICIHR